VSPNAVAESMPIPGSASSSAAAVTSPGRPSEPADFERGDRHGDRVERHDAGDREDEAGDQRLLVPDAESHEDEQAG
jgi:hypothetical protein